MLLNCTPSKQTVPFFARNESYHSQHELYSSQAKMYHAMKHKVPSQYELYCAKIVLYDNLSMTHSKTKKRTISCNKCETST